MQKMLVGIDLDDVCAEFTKRVLEEVEVDFQVHIEYESLTHWDNNPLKRGVFGNQTSWWKWLSTKAWFCDSMLPTAGCIEALTALRARGHTLEIVTTKPDWARPYVSRWISKWRLPVDQVTFVPMTSEKCDYTVSQILVDDSPRNLHTWVDGGRPAVVFSRPWNLGIEPTGWQLVRAHDWSHVLRLINGFERVEIL